MATPHIRFESSLPYPDWGCQSPQILWIFIKKSELWQGDVSIAISQVWLRLTRMRNSLNRSKYVDIHFTFPSATSQWRAGVLYHEKLVEGRQESHAYGTAQVKLNLRVKPVRVHQDKVLKTTCTHSQPTYRLRSRSNKEMPASPAYFVDIFLCASYSVPHFSIHSYWRVRNSLV